MAIINGALIGCGFFAVNHMHGWQDIDDVNIVAICDKDPARLAAVGDQFDIARRYENAEDMLVDGSFDFVDIATTVETHLPLVKLSAAHKLPTICQKPFALNIEDAKAMVSECEQAGVPLMVHENFRWQSAIQKLKAVIDSGEIGEPFWGRVSFRSAYDVFSGQPYLAEGERFIIEDLGIHALDIARFILGDAHTVTARTRRVNEAIRGEDVATMLLDHDNGSHSVVDCSYASKLNIEPFPETLIEIDGNLGTIRLRQGYKMEIQGKNGVQVIEVSPELLNWASKPWHNIQESVLTIQQHWVKCLTEEQETQTSGKDNLKTFALVEAAYQSANSQKSVQLSDLLN